MDNNQPITDNVETSPVENEKQIENSKEAELKLLNVLKLAINGDLTVRLPENNELGEIAPLFNQWLHLNEKFANEIVEISKKVGEERKLNERLIETNDLWGNSINSINSLIDNLAKPTIEAQRVIGAIASGDLSQKMALEVDGRPLNGELQLGTIVNAMVDLLNVLTSEINRMTREVGTEGKLSSQVVVEGAAGIWKELIENVNRMGTTLGGQIRNIAEIATAISKGDLTKKITVETQGELEIFKNTVNDMVEQLNVFASEITRVAREVGTEGQLGSQAVVESAAGTWKELIDNINRMSINLTDQIGSIGEVMLALAQGNLSKQITEKNAGEFQQLSDRVNQMIANLTASIKQMAEVATAVSSASEELTAVSKEMTENANQTAEQATSASASAEQVSTNAASVSIAVEQMNASIKEIAKNAALGAKVATQAVKTADSTNATITKLGQSSVEIGKVIKVITSIAQQTNLLALNATIEAARAGEAGRGFAVVATEVKELAKQTAKATEDISQRIEAIQADTNSAVSAISQITGIINQINDLQNTIASAVEEQTATTTEISRNVAEAAKGSSDIAKNIGIVAVNAQSTTIGANNTSQAASELSRMAVELQKVVGNFQY
ncbi:MAG TPA: methyl-accepting chemotaxis protein [Leptolyngbyaceae cyanobacterium]